MGAHRRFGIARRPGLLPDDELVIEAGAVLPAELVVGADDRAELALFLHRLEQALDGPVLWYETLPLNTDDAAAGLEHLHRLAELVRPDAVAVRAAALAQAREVPASLFADAFLVTGTSHTCSTMRAPSCLALANVSSVKLEATTTTSRATCKAARTVAEILSSSLRVQMYQEPAARVLPFIADPSVR